jgi:hypothetical protein
MDCGVIDHDPPVFAWHAVGERQRYQLRLTSASGTTHRETEFPWLFFPQKLGPGEFSWQVRATGAGEWSAVRRFRIASGAADFLIPDVSASWQRALGTVRPRAQPPGDERQAWLADLATTRKSGWDGLRERVKRQVGIALPGEPAVDPRTISDRDARASASIPLMDQMVNLVEAAREAALVASIEQQAAMISEARRRTLHLAGLNPLGATSFRAEPGSARRLVWVLAVNYDWLYEHFSAQERRLIEESVKRRASDLVASVLSPVEGVINRPLNSYANDSLPSALSIAILMAGNLPEAEAWMRTLLPHYLAWLNAWGGEDGGFAQGTSYLAWGISTAENWDILRWTTGIDVTRKSWLRNVGRSMVYFVPPGSPVGSFGDGAEADLRTTIDRVFRAYAARVPDPLYRWYSGQLFGGDETSLSILLAPPLKRGEPFPKSAPDAIWLPSVGWAAMHSSLVDRSRVSMYFKSSPYGSFSHSHADQNSFVVNARGRALAIDSGSYDYFGSPHHLAWTKTTAAHNAITFDGGKGQSLGADGLGDANARGRVSHFQHGEIVDIVSGEAAQAYVGELTRAGRTLVFIRPQTLLVFDTLASKRPRRWEWNIHGASMPGHADDSGFTLQSGDTRLCGRVAAQGPVRLDPNIGPIPPPAKVRAGPAGSSQAGQWHGRYSSQEVTLNWSFAAVMAVDCGPDMPVSKYQPDGSWLVSGSGWQVRYKDGHATYSASATGAETVKVK